MSRDTKIRLAISVLIFMMVQAVTFGIGMIALLHNPNEINDSHFFWVRVIVVASCLISAPVSWWLAPHLRARYGRRHEKSVIDSIS